MSSKDKQDETQDDPLGIGVSSSDLYIILGIGICFVLLVIIGMIFWMRSGSSGEDDGDGEGDGGDGSGEGDVDCDEGFKIPSHFTVEFKYGEGVNPYNNFALPPVLPRPPEFFGS
jgi:flagellar basal body-associated protein FliL